MRCAIYIRVSTEEQASEGFSIRAQKERLEMFAMSQDWDIIDFYIDEGKSAKDTNREELRRMIEDINKNKIDVVLVYKLDRLTRSVMDLYNLLEKFDQHGCMFKSCTEVFDTTTPTGRLFITLVAAVAQWERENSADRVKFGMIQMTQEGKWHGGTVPYGYTYNTDTKSLEINSDEAKTLRYIYKLYQEGKGDNAIANIVSNEMKINSRNGFAFSSKTIRDLLTNPAAYGSIRYGDELYENFMEGIITKEEFERCQEIRLSKRNIHPRNVSSSYIFSGIVRCKRCGSPLKGKQNKVIKGKSYKYLTCINTTEKRCNLPILSEKNLENQFLNHMKIIDSHLGEVWNTLNTSDELTNENEVTINNLRKQLSTIKERKKKWQIAYANDVITLEELKGYTEKDIIRNNEIKKQLNELEKEINLNVNGEMENFDFSTNWNKLNGSEKKQSAMIILESFLVDTDDNQKGNHSKRKLTLSNFKFK